MILMIDGAASSSSALADSRRMMLEVVLVQYCSIAEMLCAVLLTDLMRSGGWPASSPSDCEFEFSLRISYSKVPALDAVCRGSNAP